MLWTTRPPSLLEIRATHWTRLWQLRIVFSSEIVLLLELGLSQMGAKNTMLQSVCLGQCRYRVLGLGANCGGIFAVFVVEVRHLRCSSTTLAHWATTRDPESHVRKCRFTKFLCERKAVPSARF